MAKRALRAILIDPITETLAETWVSQKDPWSDFKRMLDCPDITLMYGPHQTVFVVDDIALLRENPDQFGYWQPIFRENPICNKALLLKITKQEGDFCSTDLEIDFVHKLIKWPKVRYLCTEKIERKVTHPIFGEMDELIFSPVFTAIKKEDMN